MPDDSGLTGTPGSAKTTRLGPGVEFDFIRDIWRRLGARGANLGDDCAILDVDGSRLAISVDLTLEGTHFRRGWLAPDELGWRATAAALSDLAAVAASPRGILVSLGLSPEMPSDWAGEVMDGAGAAAASVGATVWGGDIVRSDRIVMDVVVLGSVSGHPVTRAGAQPGNVLAVTGRLGGVHAALDDLLHGRTPDATAFERMARPLPRIPHAQWLRDRGATAMIDVSDGLLADAQHIAAASGVGVVVNQDALPLHPAARDSAAAGHSGEEYELLVALPADTAEALGAQFGDAFDLPLTVVGAIEAGETVTVLEHGRVVPETTGFRHF